MELTTYLSKVLGLSLVILGAVIAIRRRYFIPVFGAIVDDRLTRAVLSIIELVGGLFLIVAHNVWSPLPAAIISLLGWMAVIEASLYLLLPDGTIKSLLAPFNTNLGYVAGGLLAIVVGIYLAGSGFAFW